MKGFPPCLSPIKPLEAIYLIKTPRKNGSFCHCLPFFLLMAEERHFDVKAGKILDCGMCVLGSGLWRKMTNHFSIQ